ncbi:MAG TPA: transporter [Gammaproteobacteria bacterium]|nr:transporter [Gammaproteobacteria bacterium]
MTRAEKPVPPEAAVEEKLDPVASARLLGLQTALHAHALVYGFLFEPDRPVRELGWDDLETALENPDAFVWLHFNAANEHTKKWIKECPRLSESAAAFLLDADERQRVEIEMDGVIGVISDVHYGFDWDPDQIAALRFYVDCRCLITTRFQPLTTTNQLRRTVREGAVFKSSAALMVSLFRLQTDIHADIAGRLSRELGVIEDDILAGRIEDQRAKLGKVRRLAVRMHRHFSPEYRALRRLGARPPGWFDDADALGLNEIVEEFGMVVEDLDAIQERAKLLQEELVGQVAEDTNHNLFVLSIVTAVFLPVTLITGIFGMNVGGLPGLQEMSAFWWVVSGMVVVALVTLLILHWNRLF